ncbi:DUF4349 domain-containing protein [Terriglobus albidus]|uniref:DUF4349 domain-containing protein n=1 Tax=Terriglobus albidus TaxID=1592106 RepID=A0A5B9E996_9BACT|nr:DUF4349 domain-containing protein [Terriglobus albidus]QEE26877.1 DUF4349 domain-containing protein [Terriglobus albidus]
MSSTVTAQHPFSPEEIMAWLDGELPAAEAQQMEAHLFACEVCSGVAADMRRTSASLAAWEVPPGSSTMPAQVRDLLDETPKEKQLPNLKWIVAGAGASLLLLILVWAGGTRRVEYISKSAILESPPLALRTPERLATPRSRYTNDRLGVGEDVVAKQQLDLSAAKPATLIARRAMITVQTSNVLEARTRTESILRQYQGYAASLQVETPRYGGRIFNAELRVPDTVLDEACGALRGLGKVMNESQSGEDVTAQSADLDQRLKTARVTEERFRAILQQRTGSISDVLEVEESAARIRGEIEQMEADEKTLHQRVTFATVTLHAEEITAESKEATLPARLHDALRKGWRHIADTASGFLLFLAEYGALFVLWTILLGLPGWFLWRRYRRGQRNL